MNKIKHSNIFKVISFVLITAFIAFDISWAYPPEHSTQNSTLATPSLVQTSQPATPEALIRALELRKHFSNRGTVCDIAKFLFEDKIKLEYLAETLGKELGGFTKDSVLSHVQVIVMRDGEPKRLEPEDEVPQDAIILVRYDSKGKDKKEGMFVIALKNNPYIDKLPGRQWFATEKYIIKVLSKKYDVFGTKSFPAGEGFEDLIESAERHIKMASDYGIQSQSDKALDEYEQAVKICEEILRRKDLAGKEITIFRTLSSALKGEEIIDTKKRELFNKFTPAEIILTKKLIQKLQNLGILGDLKEVKLMPDVIGNSNPTVRVGILFPDLEVGDFIIYDRFLRKLYKLSQIYPALADEVTEAVLRHENGHINHMLLVKSSDLSIDTFKDRAFAEQLAEAEVLRTMGQRGVAVHLWFHLYMDSVYESKFKDENWMRMKIVEFLGQRFPIAKKGFIDSGIVEKVFGIEREYQKMLTQTAETNKVSRAERYQKDTKNDTPEDRWHRIIALGKRDSIEAIELLIDALTDEDWQVYDLVVDSLVKKGKAAVPALNIALKDSNPDIGQAAQIILEKIIGTKSFPVGNGMIGGRDSQTPIAGSPLEHKISTYEGVTVYRKSRVSVKLNSSPKAREMAYLINAALIVVSKVIPKIGPPVAIHVLPKVKSNVQKRIEDGKAHLLFDRRYIETLLKYRSPYPKAIRWIMAERLLHELSHDDRMGTPEEERFEEVGVIINSDLRLFRILLANPELKAEIDRFFDKTGTRFGGRRYFKALLEQIAGKSDSEIGKAVEAFVNNYYDFSAKSFPAGSFDPFRAIKIKIFIKRLQNGDSSVRKAAFNALVKIGTPAIPALIIALGDSKSYVREAAFNALEKLNALTTELKVQRYIADLGYGGPAVREAACNALGAIGPAPSSAVPVLIIIALGCSDPNVRKAACNALGAIGSEAKDAIASLTALMKDSKDDELIVAAATALISIDGGTEDRINARMEANRRIRIGMEDRRREAEAEESASSSDDSSSSDDDYSDDSRDDEPSNWQSEVIDAYNRRGKGDSDREFVDHTRNDAYLQINPNTGSVREISREEYNSHPNKYSDGRKSFPAGEEKETIHTIETIAASGEKSFPAGEKKGEAVSAKAVVPDNLVISPVTKDGSKKLLEKARFRYPIDKYVDKKRFSAWPLSPSIKEQDMEKWQWQLMACLDQVCADISFPDRNKFKFPNTLNIKVVSGLSSLCKVEIAADLNDSIIIVDESLLDSLDAKWLLYAELENKILRMCLGSLKNRFPPVAEDIALIMVYLARFNSFEERKRNQTILFLQSHPELDNNAFRDILDDAQNSVPEEMVPKILAYLTGKSMCVDKAWVQDNVRSWISTITLLAYSNILVNLLKQDVFISPPLKIGSPQPSKAFWSATEWIKMFESVSVRLFGLKGKSKVGGHEQVQTVDIRFSRFIRGRESISLNIPARLTGREYIIVARLIAMYINDHIVNEGSSDVTITTSDWNLTEAVRDILRNEYSGMLDYVKKYYRKKENEEIVRFIIRSTNEIRNYEKNIVIGLDLGGSSKIKAVVIEEGNIVFSSNYPISGEKKAEDIETTDEYVRIFADIIDRVVAESDTSKQNIYSVGISWAGAVNDNGEIAATSKIVKTVSENADEQPPLVKMRGFGDLLTERTGVPVRIVNDGDALAFGLATYAEMKDTLCLGFGTSLAVGYIDENGRLVSEFGEGSKTIADMADQSAAHTGTKVSGVVQQYASQNGVVRVAEGYEEFENLLENVTPANKAQRIGEEVELYNKNGEAVLDKVADFIAVAIAKLHRHYRMEHVILSGGVMNSESGMVILAKVREKIRANFPVLDPANIETSEMIERKVEGMGRVNGKISYADVANAVGAAQAANLKRQDREQITAGSIFRTDTYEGIELSSDGGIIIKDGASSRTAQLAGLMRLALKDAQNVVPQRVSPIQILVLPFVPAHAKKHISPSGEVTLHFGKEFIETLLLHQDRYPNAVPRILAERLIHELSHDNRIGSQEEERLEEIEVIINRDLPFYRMLLNRPDLKAEVDRFFDETGMKFGGKQYFKDLLDRIVKLPEVEIRKVVEGFVDTYYDFSAKSFPAGKGFDPLAEYLKSPMGQISYSDKEDEIRNVLKSGKAVRELARQSGSSEEDTRVMLITSLGAMVNGYEIFKRRFGNAIAEKFMKPQMRELRGYEAGLAGSDKWAMKTVRSDELSFMSYLYDRASYYGFPKDSIHIILNEDPFDMAPAKTYFEGELFENGRMGIKKLIFTIYMQFLDQLFDVNKVWPELAKEMLEETLAWHKMYLEPEIAKEGMDSPEAEQKIMLSINQKLGKRGIAIWLWNNLLLSGVYHTEFRGEWLPKMADRVLKGMSGLFDESLRNSILREVLNIDSEYQRRLKINRASGTKSFPAGEEGSKRKADQLYYRATERKHAGDIEGAFEDLKKAVELDPCLASAWYDLGNAYKIRMLYLQAIEAYKKCLEMEPDALDALMNLANTLLQTNRYEEAVKYYEKILEINPNFPYARGNLDAARKGIEVIAAASKEAKTPAEKISFGITSLIESGKREEAIALARRFAEENPFLAEAYRILGFTYGMSGVAISGPMMLDESIAAYRKAIALDPQSAEIHQLLGIQLEKKGLLDEARREYEAAISLAKEPGDVPHALLNLGNIYSEQSMPRKAIRQYLKVIDSCDARSPFVKTAKHNLTMLTDVVKVEAQGIVFHSHGDGERLTPEEIKRCQEIFSPSKTVGAWKPSTQGEVLLIDNTITAIKEHRFTNSKDIINKLFQKFSLMWLESGKSSKDIIFILGYIYTVTGDLKSAVNAFTIAIQLSPDYALAHERLGIVLRRIGEQNEARKHLEKALSLDANMHFAQLNLGSMTLEKGVKDADVGKMIEAITILKDLLTKSGQMDRQTIDLAKEELAIARESVMTYANLASMTGRSVEYSPEKDEGFDRKEHVEYLCRALKKRLGGSFGSGTKSFPAGEEMRIGGDFSTPVTQSPAIPSANASIDNPLKHRIFA